VASRPLLSQIVSNELIGIVVINSQDKIYQIDPGTRGLKHSPLTFLVSYLPIFIYLMVLIWYKNFKYAKNKLISDRSLFIHVNAHIHSLQFIIIQNQCEHVTVWKKKA